jgi:prepilin-type processing-associated H-X9-DG protein
MNNLITTPRYREKLKTTAAFSLIELLVVVALVTLIAGLVLPNLARATRQSGLLQCKSNLKQVGWAIEMYTKDQNDYLPGPLWQGVYAAYQKAGPVPGSEGSSSYTTWAMAFHLATYLGHPAPSITRREVPELTCPTSVASKPNLAQSPPLAVHLSFLTTIYVTNNPTGFPFDRITNPFGRPSGTYEPTEKLASILRPSEQWAITDGDRSNAAPGASYYPYLPEPVHNDRPGGSRGAPYQRNYLFFDGSVRSAQSGARVHQ